MQKFTAFFSVCLSLVAAKETLMSPQTFEATAVPKKTQEPNVSHLDIHQLNTQIDTALKDQNSSYLSILLKQKESLLKKAQKILNKKNRHQSLKLVKSIDYGYVSITSQVKNTEIYIDDEFIGFAPIQHHKLAAKDKPYTITARANSRYYETTQFDTTIKKMHVKTLDATPTKGNATIFLVGPNEATITINNNHTFKLSQNRASTIDIKADNRTHVLIQNDNGAFYKTTLDVWQKHTYELFYTLKNAFTMRKIDKELWVSDINKVTTYKEAKQLCSNANLTLPTSDELLSISQHTTLFEVVPTSMYFWSTTPNSSQTQRIVSLENQKVAVDTKSSKYATVCVKKATPITQENKEQLPPHFF